MPYRDSHSFHRRVFFLATIVVFLWTLAPPLAVAQGAAGETATKAQFDAREMLAAGGVVGLIIIAMSVFMVALIVEHAISIRRGALMPPGLADEVHQLMSQQRFAQAAEHCRGRSSFLGNMLASGLSEIGLSRRPSAAMCCSESKHIVPSDVPGDRQHNVTTAIMCAVVFSHLLGRQIVDAGGRSQNAAPERMSFEVTPHDFFIGCEGRLIDRRG